MNVIQKGDVIFITVDYGIPTILEELISCETIHPSDMKNKKALFTADIVGSNPKSSRYVTDWSLVPRDLFYVEHQPAGKNTTDIQLEGISKNVAKKIAKAGYHWELRFNHVNPYSRKKK